MALIKFVIGVVGSILAVVITAKLVAFVLGLIGVVLQLVWMIVILSLICLIGYAIYKVATPRRVEGA